MDINQKPIIDLTHYLPQESAQKLMAALGFVLLEEDSDNYVINLFGLTDEEYRGTEEARKIRGKGNEISVAPGTLAAAEQAINDLSNWSYSPRSHNFALSSMIKCGWISNRHGSTRGYGLTVERRNAAYFSQVPSDLLQPFADALAKASKISEGRRSEFQNFRTEFSQYTGVPFATVIDWFKKPEEHELKYDPARHKKEDGEARTNSYAELVFAEIPKALKPPFTFDKGQNENGSFIKLTFGAAKQLLVRLEEAENTALKTSLLYALQNPSIHFNRKVMPQIILTLENLIQLKMVDILLVALPLDAEIERKAARGAARNGALRIVTDLTAQEKIIEEMKQQVRSNLSSQWHEMASILKVQNAGEVKVNLFTGDVHNDMLAQAVRERVQNLRLNGTAGDKLPLQILILIAARERAAEWMIKFRAGMSDPFNDLKRSATVRTQLQLTAART